MVRVLLLMLFAMGGGADDAVTVKARVKVSSLRPNDLFEIECRFILDKGYVASEAGLPNPILQIKVPPSVALEEPVLRSDRELQQNEFLHAPYERLITKTKTRIPCRLKREPGPDEHFSLNFLAYVGRKDGPATFVRRRLELPVKARAKAAAVDASPSDWGEVDFLGIGDRADDFDLPRADGSRVKLSDHIGKHNVVVTMYRAFW